MPKNAVSKANAKWTFEHYYLFIVQFIDYKKNIDRQQLEDVCCGLGSGLQAENEEVDFRYLR